jgi:hypothetical protein
MAKRIRDRRQIAGAVVAERRRVAERIRHRRELLERRLVSERGGDSVPVPARRVTLVTLFLLS